MATPEDYLKNKKWVTRMTAAFLLQDRNKNGYISQDNYMSCLDKMAQLVTDRPAELARLRETIIAYVEALGITGDTKIDKQKFIELAATLAVNELAKFKKGEETWIEKNLNATFDVVDRNHDGYVTWEEYKIAMAASNLDEKSAQGTFKLLDKNKNGKIERKELISVSIKFWLDLEESELDKLFGGKH